MKINRESALKGIIFLCILLLMSVMALAVVIKSNEMNQPQITITSVVMTPSQVVHITMNQSEQVCDYTKYQDPNQFHRIYY